MCDVNKLLDCETMCCLFTVASSVHRAESSDDSDPQHQLGRSGPVWSPAYRPQFPKIGWQEEERPVQEAHCGNFRGNAMFGR